MSEPSPIGWERTLISAEKVKERLAARPVDNAGVPYAVAGGNAVAEWVEESEQAIEFQVVSLDALVRLELMSWQLKNRMHLRDLIDVGLIDASWPARLPVALGKRLQELLDNPNG